MGSHHWGIDIAPEVLAELTVEVLRLSYSKTVAGSVVVF